MRCVCVQPLNMVTSNVFLFINYHRLQCCHSTWTWLWLFSSVCFSALHTRGQILSSYDLLSIASSLWIGEVISKVGDMCVTAGWPMLTSAAFKDPEGQTVVVLLNEATVSTEIILKDSVKGSMKFGINSRSMQTIIYWKAYVRSHPPNLSWCHLQCALKRVWESTQNALSASQLKNN